MDMSEDFDCGRATCECDAAGVGGYPSFHPFGRPAQSDGLSASGASPSRITQRLRRGLGLCRPSESLPSAMETEIAPGVGSPPCGAHCRSHLSSSWSGAGLLGLLSVGSKRTTNEMLTPKHNTDWSLLYHTRNETQGNLLRSWQRRRVDEYCTAKMPSLIQERQLPYDQRKAYDKAFAATWTDENHVLVGTKCNNLLKVNVRTGAKTEIPLELRKADPSVEPPSDHWLKDSKKCGIRSMCISPTGEYLATGAEDPRHAAVLRLPGHPPRAGCSDAPSHQSSGYSNVQTLAGHADWVFGMAWVTEKHLATCSRDRSITLWSIDDADSLGLPRTCKTPAAAVTAHQSKVRDVRFDFKTQTMSSLGADATVRLWDAKLQPIHKIKLQNDDELVCLAHEENVIAVGSQNYIMIRDQRAPDLNIQNVHALERNQSIRSVSVQNHLLTVGSGFGKISFYDLRANKFMEWESKGSSRQTLDMGQGWLCPNTIFRDHFYLTPVQPACYAHCWDISGSRLFTCGGPLAYGLIGCYMALWE